MARDRIYPAGVQTFSDIIEQGMVYIDKTALVYRMVKKYKYVFLGRPRRFGKSLLSSTLHSYFAGQKDLFKGLAIEQLEKDWIEYPVLHFDMSVLKNCSVDRLPQKFNNLLKDYEEALGINNSTETPGDRLSEIIKFYYKKTGKKVVIIIDEYDTPIQQGYLHGFYDQVVSFMRNFFSGGFKDNRHLAFGFLTGILRVARESIFSGLNNLVVNSVLDKKYSEYFGFTRAEVAEMASYYNVEDKLTEICDWYDGYRFGNTEIFNPWSVINYFSNDCEARSYWVSTSSNDIIGEVLKESDHEIWENLANFLQGEKLLTYIDTCVVYPQIKQNPSSVYSFLLMSGYLKIAGKNQPLGAGYMCEVGIPNREIMFVYQKEILDQLSYMIPQSASIGILEAVYTGNTEILGKRLNKLLKTTVSYYDTAQESFYHGLMLGLLAMTDDRYRLLSNDESGDGRYDICLIPRQKNLPGIIIELKAEKKCGAEELKTLAEKAIEQIEEKHYDMQLKEEKVEHIIKYGVAFSGKNAEVVMKEN